MNSNILGGENKMKRGEMPSLRSYNSLITRLDLEPQSSGPKPGIPSTTQLLLCLVGMVVRRAGSGLSPTHWSLRQGLDQQTEGHPTCPLPKSRLYHII